MFDFLGTFRSGEWEPFRDFIRTQSAESSQRLDSLRTQIQKIGWIEYTIENNVRTAYRINPPESLLARHAKLFEFYGGNLLDLKIRSRGDWIYLTKGELTLGDTPYLGGLPSDGDYQDSRHYDDAVPGNAMDKLKRWQLPAIKKLEDLEFKIKRTIDLGDQLLNEALLIVRRTTGAETIEELIDRVEYYLSSDDFPSARDS